MWNRPCAVVMVVEVDKFDRGCGSGGDGRCMENVLVTKVVGKNGNRCKDRVDVLSLALTPTCSGTQARR